MIHTLGITVLSPLQVFLPGLRFFGQSQDQEPTLE
jgi:hypothetical protein